MNRQTMMLIGLTILSAGSARTVAQVAKDASTRVQAVHEIQVTLRKYEFSPGTLRVRKGERVKLVMTAADHDHGFKLDDFNIDQKYPREQRLSSNSPLTRLARSNFAARVSAV
jgi:heme/copper-type cytochrome/quinol oxidase subunit 2